MTNHVVAAAADVPPGERLKVDVAGTAVAIFNLDGEYYGLLDRCPHMGASLCGGRLIGLVESDGPGRYRYSRGGEIVRCPWHGWEFDIRTGKSRFDPSRWKTRAYAFDVAKGEDLVEQAYEAETVEVTVENEYIVVEL